MTRYDKTYARDVWYTTMILDEEVRRIIEKYVKTTKGKRRREVEDRMRKIIETGNDV